MFPPQDISELVAKIAQALRESHSTLAVSESACGGLISSYLVSIPRASSFFVGGTTTYALKSRLHLSGWSEQDIASYTGPSVDVAKRLARNLKMELGATFTLAETGWAGPMANPEDAVGTVYLGIAGPGVQQAKTMTTGSSDRSTNMEAFAKLALEYLLEILEGAQQNNSTN